MTYTFIDYVKSKQFRMPVEGIKSISVDTNVPDMTILLMDNGAKIRVRDSLTSLSQIPELKVKIHGLETQQQTNPSEDFHATEDDVSRFNSIFKIPNKEE